MKRIITVMLTGLIITSVNAQMDNPVHEGMQHTVTLVDGEVIYDLNGEWEAVWDTGGYGTYNDIIKIVQKGNEFSGVYLWKGDYHLGKDKEKVKGKLKGNLIEEVFLNDVDAVSFELYWAPSQGRISNDGNEVVIKRERETKGATTTRVLLLKRSRTYLKNKDLWQGLQRRKSGAYR